MTTEGGAKPETPCVWPFIYDGVTYDGQCTNAGVSIRHDLILIQSLKENFCNVRFFSVVYNVQFHIGS